MFEAPQHTQGRHAGVRLRQGGGAHDFGQRVGLRPREFCAAGDDDALHHRRLAEDFEVGGLAEVRDVEQRHAEAHFDGARRMQRHMSDDVRSDGD